MDYESLRAQMNALLDADDEPITTLSNAAALLYESLGSINWAGFYLYKNGALVLGPFQGRPACTRIAVGRGVCGTAYERRECVVVKNVHNFPGHIACDSASNSEIVLPLHDRAGKLIGVMDIDSPIEGRFTDADRSGLEAIERVIASCLTDFMREHRLSSL